jgi:hypothetical protein
LFFELVLALANPSLVSGLACRLQSNPSVGKYGLLAIALFLALVIGNTLMLLVSLIQFLLGVGYRTCARLRWVFERHVLAPALSWWFRPAPALNWWFRPRNTPRKHSQWLGRFYQRLREKMFFPQATPGFLWWWAMAKRLLLTRYGLKEEQFHQISTNVDPLAMVLTTPTVNEIRGSLFMIVAHATGWSAIIAVRFAPALRTIKWYWVFCAFLVGNGLLHDVFLVKRNNDPVLSYILRLRAVLREFPPISREDKVTPAAGGEDADV